MSIKLHQVPHFIIIGAQKGGTSSLFHYLSQHPQLNLPKKKELHFFDLNYKKGIDWYKSQFPQLSSDSFKTGEASPYYLFHPHVPQRIYKDFPNTKIIIMLRNPIDRAYSQYMMQKKRKFDSLPSFDEAIAAEPSRLKNETLKLLKIPYYKSINHQRLSYLARGMYYSQIKRWLKYFPINQFLFIKSEAFFSNSGKELQKVNDFLEIGTQIPRDLQIINKNNYPPINEKTKVFLTNYFAKENKKLADLLGQEFIWDT
ncbi:MAG: sulfotransferase [Bacteroidales bacterium]|nr:sulfotransferase [Bacteroidales bacterium]